MLSKLIQSHRRKKLIAAILENHGDHVYACEYGWSCNKLVYDVRGGELVAFNTRDMREVPADSFTLPALSEMSKLDARPEDQSYKDFVDAIEFMKVTGFPRNAGSPYFDSVRGTLYIHPGSLGVDGLWINLLTQDGEPVRFPAAAFHMIYNHQRVKGHNKYLQHVGIWFDQPTAPFTPIIEVIRLADGAVNGAGNLLRTSDICDAIKVHESYDVVIDIARLDNSSAPVVDMAVFLKALRYSVLYNDEGYTLDVSRIKLRMGMFPSPIPVGRLQHENPSHRVILSSTPAQANIEHYTNTDVLPQGYP